MMELKLETVRYSTHANSACSYNTFFQERSRQTLPEQVGYLQGKFTQKVRLTYFMFLNATLLKTDFTRHRPVDSCL